MLTRAMRGNLTFESITSPEELYRLRVPATCNELLVPLRTELDDQFLFCKAEWKSHGYELTPQVMFSSSKILYYIKKGGEITGFSQVTKPYVLRDVLPKPLMKAVCYLLPFFESSNKCFERMLQRRCTIISSSTVISKLSLSTIWMAGSMSMFSQYTVVLCRRQVS